MRAYHLASIALLGTFAASQASAASVRTGQDVSRRGSHHPASSKHLLPKKHAKKKHPKHHPHPHPHPHPAKATALPTDTAAGSISASTKSLEDPASNPSPQASPAVQDSPPVVQSPPQKVVCQTGASEFALYNVPFTTFRDDQQAYPNPRLTFDSAFTQMKTTDASDPSRTVVTFHQCTSTYMDYDQFTYYAPPRRRDLASNTTVPLERRGSDPQYDFQTYGQLRVPAFDNLCIVAANVGVDTMRFELASCSMDDDATQVRQYFRQATYSDSAIRIQLLGAPYSTAQSASGLHYTEDTRYIDLYDPLQNIISTSPSSRDASFYSGPLSP